MENRMTALEQRFGGMETAVAEILQRLNETTIIPRRRRDPRNGDATDGENSPIRSRSSSRGSDHRRPYVRGGRRKLEIPVFSGEDAHGWLVRVERYFRINGVREREKLDAVVIAMEGSALNWFQWWEEEAPLRNWDEFKNAVKRRFHPGSINNPMGPLLRLRQEGTVKEYREKFESYIAPLQRHERVMLDSIFLNGLKDEIQTEVKLYDYEDLAELMDRALMLEEKNEALDKKKQPWKGKGEWKGTTPKFRSTWEHSNEKKEGDKNEGWKGKKLSSAELEERHKKGLCFKCGEKWNREHVCKFKHMQLMLCEVDEESDEGEIEVQEGTAMAEVKTLQLSLQSKEGLTSNKSFKVWGVIKGRKVLVLVDSGATSNFIAPKLVQELNLTMIDTPVYVVEIGTGERVRNKGVCKNLMFTV